MHLHEGKLTISKHISQFATPEEWLAHVSSYRLARRKAPASKAVPDVKITCTSKSFMIKFVTRETRYLTEAEIDLLCAEYGLEHAFLLEKISTRKIAILNEKGEQTNVSQPKPRKARASKRAKENAECEQGLTGSDSSRDKLI